MNQFHSSVRIRVAQVDLLFQSSNQVLAVRLEDNLDPQLVKEVKQELVCKELGII